MGEDDRNEDTAKQAEISAAMWDRPDPEWWDRPEPNVTDEHNCSREAPEAGQVSDCDACAVDHL